MIENIERELYSDKIKQIIKDFYKKTNSLYVSSIFIGEIFLYYSINKEFNGFDDYINDMYKLYDETIDFEKYNYQELKKSYRNISNIFDEVILDTEVFKVKRAKNIIKSIMKKLGIDKDIESLTKEEKIKIKEDFIDNYITNGFVIHSFHSALYDSIMSKGLSSSDRIWDDKEVLNIGNIFFDKGAFGALGGYSYYNGQGLYFEHNYRKLYSHAIYSPEWFNFLTSSNHLTGFPDIDRAPYTLKKYDACKQNVLDLCDNVGLNNSQKIDVLNMFNKYFNMFKSKDTMVAIIPKKIVNKHKIDNELIKDKNLLETIIYLTDDINGEYKEHFGNVCTDKIHSKDFIVIKLPHLEDFIDIDNFTRETKEELFELSAVEHMKRHLARILNSIGDTKKAEKLLKDNTYENN